MGILAVLLHEKNLYFSEEHLNDIYEKSSFMTHRGEIGNFYNDHQIALSHQSNDELASQPFRFSNDRYVLVFDGLIHNIVELRHYLMDEGYVFETKMETEVIAKLFIHKKWECFSMLRGSFAILIWDQEMKTLYGARDHFGMKPLYYMTSNEEMIFSSEKKSTLFACYEERIDDFAFHQYLDYKYVSEPYTMTKGIRKVKPGHFFIKKLDTPISFHRYFHGTFRPEKEKQPNLVKDIREALYESVDIHLRERGQNGVLLQNNIYSIALATIVNEIDPNVTAFSATYGEDSSFSNEIVDQLKINHMPVEVTAEQFVAYLPKIMWILDDPFADADVITNYFISKLAGEQVKTMIRSEGAEEVFGCFTDSRTANRSQNMIERLMGRLPSIIAKDYSSKDVFQPLFTTNEKKQVLKRIIAEESTHQNLLMDVKDEHEIIKRQYIRLHSELPSNRLNYIEKLTSANGLELLLPFLDYELFSVLREIPIEQKGHQPFIHQLLEGTFSKGEINDLLNNNRSTPTVPIYQWLTNECYFWAKDLIHESETEYLIDKSVVFDMLERNAHGKKGNVKQLWTILIFMTWHQVYVEDKYDFRSGQRVERESLIGLNR